MLTYKLRPAGSEKRYRRRRRRRRVVVQSDPSIQHWSAGSNWFCRAVHCTLLHITVGSSGGSGRLLKVALRCFSF